MRLAGVGAAVMTTLQNYLVSAGSWITVIQGVIFVLCVLMFRAGITGTIAERLKRSL